MPQRALRMNLLGLPEFCAAHLRHVTGGPISTVDFDEAEAAFGMSSHAIDDFYSRELRNEQIWPYFRIPLRTGATLEIEYSNVTEDHEVIYRLQHQNWRNSITVGKSGGHWLLPAFRWTELLGISNAAATNQAGVTSDQALLLLLPTAWLSQDDNVDAAGGRLLEAASRSNVAPGNQLTSVVQHLINSSRSDVRWRKDANYGWVNNESNSCRNPKGPSSLNDQELRSLTNVLGALGA